MKKQHSVDNAVANRTISIAFASISVHLISHKHDRRVYTTAEAEFYNFRCFFFCLTMNDIPKCVALIVNMSN
jgi:hypothetical protein